MIGYEALRRWVLGVCTLLCVTLTAHAQKPTFPIKSGLTIVLAVNSGATQPDAKTGGGILQGDYEMVVAFTSVNQGAITQTAAFDGFDESNNHKQLTVTRTLTPADMTSARLQVFGFHTSDPRLIEGTTTLGPSIAVTRELVEGGSTQYAFRLYANMDTISGVLTRSADSLVKFPVLLNGKRVELDAIRAVGQMGAGKGTRPFETLILDHASHPLSLRIAYGPRGSGFPFKPDFVREVVRVDFPEQQSSMAAALEKDCRAELRGIYFDFNRATLKPESQHALQEIAQALRQTQPRSFRVEGHTDNIGSESFNDDLSVKRATAVKTALETQFGIDASRLVAQGHGEHRPIEANETLAGRARNRRVELTCASR